MPERPEPPSAPRSGLSRLIAWGGRKRVEPDARVDSRDKQPRPQQLAPIKAATSVVDGAAHSATLSRLFAHSHEPEDLLRAFAEGMCGLHGELSSMGQRLLAASLAGDWPSYGRALRHLIDKYIRTIDSADPLADGRTEAEQLRDLLRHTLGTGLVILLQRNPVLAEEAQMLAAALRHWHPGHELGPLERRLRELTHQIGVRANDASEQQNLLLGLFDLLLENVGELLDDRSWMQGQVNAVRQLIAGPLDAGSIEQARNSLREVIYKQGLLKQGIAESKDAMRQMMSEFVHRLDGMAASTSQYHDRVAGYSQAIGAARSITDLNRLLQDVLQDTTAVQAQALLTRDELLEARKQVEDAEQRIHWLEQELEDVAGLVRVDALTGALNRRGLDELFERELARTRRSGQPLCVAMLDLDDFHLINELHGHHGGDATLRHMVDVARNVLNSSDAVCRFGGEEFVLVLPDTTIFEATAAVTRLQRALAQRSLLYEDVRVFVSFSAGVAICRADEVLVDVLKRADRALYQAKAAGKSRAVAAD